MMTVFLDHLFLQCFAVRFSAYHVDMQGIFVSLNFFSVSHANRRISVQIIKKPMNAF